MPPRRARRLGVFTTAVLLTAGLLAPTAAAAGPTGSAARFGPQGSATGEARAASNDPIVVRDLSYACPAGQVPAAGFRDVPSNYGFARAIDCLVGYGITQGKTRTTYGPNDAVTRQQMAVFLHRMLDDIIVLPDPPARSRFRDVSATGEAGRAINVLASDELAAMLGHRIVSGRTATTFDPTGRVTRAQMGSFIARALEGLLAAKGFVVTDRGECRGVFSDEASIPATHLENVRLLCAGGIVTGRSDGTYGPNADVTRGQMAAFLMRKMDAHVEATTAQPAHLRSEVLVDRGAAATACSDAGRDGSKARPYCSIQAGIEAAAGRPDHAVRVNVVGRPGQPAYVGDVVLGAGSAHTVDLVGLSPAGTRVPLEGTLRVEGGPPKFHTVGRMQVTAPTAIHARTAGFLGLTNVRTGGTRGVFVEQPGTGQTVLMGADLRSATTSIDVAGTGLLVARGSRFAAASQAFVLLPEGVTAPEAQALYDEFFLDAALGNRFDRAPVAGTVGSRRALVPAS